MKRDLLQFVNKEYDILVIGGGVLGLFIAWDAALRGLSVALIDKGDFGGATSSNSLRIIHGGFRYLQTLDFRKTRRFMREQRIFMKIAPHLVRPMPVLIPVYESSYLRKKSFAAAIKIYELLGLGIGVSQQSKFSNEIVTGKECIEMIPGIESQNLCYGIKFADCQLSNSERFSIQLASSSFKEGAHLANYVEALSFIIENNKVKGAAVRDNVAGNEFEIRAKVTVDASGPWLNNLLPSNGYNYSVSSGGLSKAFNVLIKRDLTKGYALGLHTQIKNKYQANLFSRSSRYLFITPWRDKSLIGTEYLSSNSGPDNFDITKKEISSLLDKINVCFPLACLKMDDVEFVYGGYVPTYIGKDGNAKIGIENHIYDHEKEHGFKGLFSARGSKYTEARIVAQETVDEILRKTGKAFKPSITESTPLYLGKYDNSKYEINNDTDDHLIKSQIMYAINEEMAQKLTDVLFRRLDLNIDNIKSNFRRYSEIMAAELNWDDMRIKKEEEDLLSQFSIFH